MAEDIIQVRYVIAEDETDATGNNRVMRLNGLAAGSQVFVAFTPGRWTPCVVERVEYWRIYVRRRSPS